MEPFSQQAPFAYIFSCYADRHLAKRLLDFLRSGRFPTLFPQNIRVQLKETYANCPEQAYGFLDKRTKEAVASTRYLIVICSEQTITSDPEGADMLDGVVRLFLQSSPLARTRLIPLIARNPKGLKAEECLPASIQEINLLGIDLAVKGRRRVFSDVLSSFAGTEPDVLWNRRGRERRKRFYKLLAASIAGLLLLSGILALISSDIFTEEAYYADYTFQHGEPQGVIPLKKEEIARMHRHYRFLYHHGKVKKVERRDSFGHLQDDDDALFGYYRPCVMEVLRRAGITILEKDAHGELIRMRSELSDDTSQVWSPSDEFSDWPELMEKGFLQGRTAPTQHVDCYRSETDEQGYLTQVSFIGAGIADGFAEDGSSGRVFTRNPMAMNRISAIRQAEPQGESAETAPHIEYTYNPLSQGGMVCDFRILPPQGKQIAEDIPTQFHYTWDYRRNLSAVTCCNSKKIFLYRTEYEYNGHGCRTHERHVTLKGEPIDIDGYCEKHFTYNQEGRLTEIITTDTAGRVMRNFADRD